MVADCHCLGSGAAFGIRMPAWPEVGLVLSFGIGIVMTMEFTKWVLRKHADVKRPT